jgi:hypothetical protein
MGLEQPLILHKRDSGLFLFTFVYNYEVEIFSSRMHPVPIWL